MIMLLSMTSPITFDEKAFIESVLDRYYNDANTDTYEEIFDNLFRLSFPTVEFCEEIRNTYYSGENYDSVSLYSILSNKVDDALFDEDDSIADTEEIEEEVEEFEEDGEYEGDDYD